MLLARKPGVHAGFQESLSLNCLTVDRQTDGQTDKQTNLAKFKGNSLQKEEVTFTKSCNLI